MESEYKQLKCKLFADKSLKVLEEEINDFISEVEECDVKDIKLNTTSYENNDFHYAMVLYY